MALTLSVLRCPDAVPPETRQVAGGEFSIGRGPDNDWTLADPDRVLSKRHCVLAFRSGGWQLADVSTNGTYLNRDIDPVGHGGARDLRDGDRLRLGNYEIEIRVVEDAAWQGGDKGQAASAFGNPFGDDPFAQPPPVPGAFGEDPLLAARGQGGGFGGPGVMLPENYNPLAPDGDGAGFAGPTQADHASALGQAFRPPAPPSNMNFDDWDLDLSAAPVAPSGTAPAAEAPLQMGSRQPAGAPGDDWDIDLSAPPVVPPKLPATAPPPLVMAVPVAPPPIPQLPAARAPVADDGPDPFAEPGRDAPAPPTRPAAATSTAPTSTPAALDGAAAGDLMAAFLRGAGMEGARPADPLAAMEQLGGAFRALVAGLRQALIARATIKGEFRIEQTMIRARGNNPLKFSAGDDDALAALLGAGRRTDVTPAAAVGEALADMRLHELATMAAMQTAVRALVERFDPAPLRIEGERSGGVLGAQKRARAFELFEKLHGDTARALADDFDSVFGKTFARAYEQALREVSDKERS